MRCQGSFWEELLEGILHFKLAEFDNKKWGETLTAYNNSFLFGEGEVVPHAAILCLVMQLCVPRQRTVAWETSRGLKFKIYVRG